MLQALVPGSPLGGSRSPLVSDLRDAALCSYQTTRAETSRNNQEFSKRLHHGCKEERDTGADAQGIDADAFIECTGGGNLLSFDPRNLSHI